MRYEEVDENVPGFKPINLHISLETKDDLLYLLMALNLSVEQIKKTAPTFLTDEKFDKPRGFSDLWRDLYCKAKSLNYL